MPLFSPTSPACWPRPRPSWPCGRRTGRSSSPTSGTWGANGAETRAGGGEIRRTLREEKTRTTSFERNLALARGACSRFFDSLNLLSNSVSLSCKKNQHPQNRTAFDLWSAFGLEVPLSLGGEGEVRERGVEKRGETFFSSLCSSFFFLPWSLWQRRAARPPPRVGEFSTRSSSFSLSPRSPLPPLSPNRPSSGLHDVRPFTLGDPDLHSGRGQVGTLEFFFVFWRFSFFFFFRLRRRRRASRHALCFVSIFLFFSNPMAEIGSGRYLDLFSLASSPSTPEGPELDVFCQTRRRRGREAICEAVKCGAEGCAISFFFLALLRAHPIEKKIQRGDGDKNRGREVERERRRLCSPPSLFSFFFFLCLFPTLCQATGAPSLPRRRRRRRRR